jgi:hypothetical protein
VGAFKKKLDKLPVFVYIFQSSAFDKERFFLFFCLLKRYTFYLLVKGKKEYVSFGFG